MTRSQFRTRLAWIERQSQQLRRQPLDAVALMRQSGMEPDVWQAQCLTSSAHRRLLLCCRQSGKSTTTAVLALHTALTQPGALVLLLSPSLRQSAELFKQVLRVYRGLAETPVAQTVLRLELQNGSRILSLPGTESTVRGYASVTLLVIDEAARVSDELYYAVRPMLAVSGGRLIALSTPFGKRGWFHQEWTEGQDWERVKIIATDCPRISAQFLEEERRSLPPLWFHSEYLCQFMETVDSMFNYDDVQAAVTTKVQPLFPRA